VADAANWNPTVRGGVDGRVGLAACHIMLVDATHCYKSGGQTGSYPKRAR
jgi:hypothetical protein